MLGLNDSWDFLRTDLSSISEHDWHTEILLGPQDFSDRGHGVHGEGAPGEAGSVFARLGSDLFVGQEQEGDVAEREGRPNVEKPCK